MASDSDQEDVLIFNRVDLMEAKELLQDSNGEVPKGERTVWRRFKDRVAGIVDYPPSIFFILGCEFCERFNYYGLRAILVLYLTKWLMFPPDTATAVFHSFVFVCYFSPLFGAVIADSWLGRYKTILYISVIYLIGSIILAATAVPPPEVPGPMVGLFLIALGTGGIKPCVSSFGGDQFSPQQAKQRLTFFSAFYFIINLGSMLSTFITPILRADVHCYQDSCYPLAFGVPAVLMFISLVIFVCGEKMYKKIQPPGTNLFGQVLKCIGLAFRRRWANKEKKEHWLDHALDSYEEEFVQDVKRLLTVLFLFLPLPLFWTLFDQQGSRWTLQATQLDGTVGTLGRLKPDQLQVLNPVMILIFIPVFEKFVYPALDKCNVSNRPLQRMVVGMVLCSVSFIVAAMVQLRIDALTEAPLAQGEVGVTFLNTVDCPVTITSTAFSANVPSHQASAFLRFERVQGQLAVSMSGSCLLDSKNGYVPGSMNISADGKQAWRLILGQDSSGATTLGQFGDQRNRSKGGETAVSLFTNLEAEFTVRLVPHSSSTVPQEVHVSAVPSPFLLLEPGRYSVLVPKLELLPGNVSEPMPWVMVDTTLSIGTGGVSTVALLRPSANAVPASRVEVVVFQTVGASSLSMAVMIPQYTVMTMGEILFSPTGLAFAYTQAPQSMRSVVSACWLLTTAVGNLITSLVTQFRLVPSQMWEFILFSGLMFVSSIVFAVMTLFYNYKPASIANLEEEATLVDGEPGRDFPLRSKEQ